MNVSIASWWVGGSDRKRDRLYSVDFKKYSRIGIQSWSPSGMGKRGQMPLPGKGLI